VIFIALRAAPDSARENVVDVYIGYLRRKLVAGDLAIEINRIRGKGLGSTGSRRAGHLLMPTKVGICVTK